MELVDATELEKERAVQIVLWLPCSVVMLLVQKVETHRLQACNILHYVN